MRKFENYAPKAYLLIIEKLTVQLNFVSTHYEQRTKKILKISWNWTKFRLKNFDETSNGLSRYFCTDQNKSGRLNYFYRTKKSFLDHCVRNWRRTPRTLRRFFLSDFSINPSVPSWVQRHGTKNTSFWHLFLLHPYSLFNLTKK